jgi:hypothetical protein
VANSNAWAGGDTAAASPAEAKMSRIGFMALR